MEGKSDQVPLKKQIPISRLMNITLMECKLSLTWKQIPAEMVNIHQKIWNPNNRLH